MKFSIIIPIYNVEKYIDNCIKSVLNQKYDNYELLLIDDGSTDNSPSICDNYKNNSRIKVYHKKNGGASDARNYGLKKATGDYVMFIDGDDFLYKNDALELLNKKLTKNKIDIIQYKMVNYYEYKDLYKYNKDIKINEKKYIDYLAELNKQGAFSVSPCNKIVKLSIIKDNEIFFEKGRVAEDIDWNFKLYLYTKSIYYINEDIYVYRRERQGSVSTKNNEKKSKDLLFIINKWFEYKYDNEQIKKIYMNFLAYEFLILKTTSKNKYFDVEEKKIIKNIEKTIFNYNENYKVKLFCKFKRIIGLKLSYMLINIYMKLKKRGLINK